MSSANSVDGGSFLAQQGLVNLGQFTGIALGPGLSGQAQGQNLLIDTYPTSAQSSAALAVSRWYIAPISGSDAADGLSPSSPLKTYAEIVRRWGGLTPNLDQDTVITWLEDASDFTDEVATDDAVLNACNLHLVGTPTAVATDVISAFTPLNRAAGTDNALTGTAITDFSPFRGMMMRIDLATLATRATGTTPPAATFTGTPLVACEPIIVNITKGGTLGVAEFAWFLNGVLQATGIVTAATVLLDGTGVTINFPAGTYNTTNFYTAFSAGYCLIDTPTGNMDPGSSPIGPTAPVTQIFGNGKQINSAGFLQWGAIRQQNYGTSAPAQTFTGLPQARYNYLKVAITTGGVVGVATFSWWINGVLQATNVLTAPAVTLGLTGLVANFPAGTYGTNNVFTATSVPAYTAPDNAPPEIQVATAGLSFTIFQLTKVFGRRLTAAAGSQNVFGFTAGFVKPQDIWFTTPQAPPMGTQTAEHLEGNYTHLSHCRVDATYYHQGLSGLEFAFNTMLSGGMSGYNYWIYGGTVGAHGVFVTGGISTGAFGVTLDGDVICHFSPSVYNGALVVGSAHIKGGSITVRNLGDLILTPNGRGIFYSAAAPNGATALWGSGNIVVRCGRSFRIVNTAGVTATNSLLLTGTPTVTLDGISAGAAGPNNPLQSIDSTTGAPTQGKVTTPLATLVADLDAGAGSNQTYAIQNPHTSSRVCMNGNNNNA